MLLGFVEMVVQFLAVLFMSDWFNWSLGLIQTQAVLIIHSTYVLTVDDSLCAIFCGCAMPKCLRILVKPFLSEPEISVNQIICEIHNHYMYTVTVKHFYFSWCNIHVQKYVYVKMHSWPRALIAASGQYNSPRQNNKPSMQSPNQ